MNTIQVVGIFDVLISVFFCFFFLHVSCLHRDPTLIFKLPVIIGNTHVHSLLLASVIMSYLGRFLRLPTKHHWKSTSTLPAPPFPYTGHGKWKIPSSSIYALRFKKIPGSLLHTSLWDLEKFLVLSSI